MLVGANESFQRHHAVSSPDQLVVAVLAYIVHSISSDGPGGRSLHIHVK